MIKIAVMTLLLALPALAQALYKCPDPVTGIVKYSQTPCTITGEGETMSIKPIPQTSGSSLPASTEEAERLEKLARTAGLERRLLVIQREIKTLQGRIDGYRNAMSNEIARLQYKKQFSKNNLAGATWEQSISDEMNAVSSKYDALIRNTQSQIDQLRNEENRLREEQRTESQLPKATP